MNLSKLLAVAMVVFAEVEEDLKDGKLTIDELIETGKQVVDKLGYGSKTIFQLKKG